MRVHAYVQHVWTSALVITILLCGQNVDGQRACRNSSADVNDIKFSVSYEYNFTTLIMGHLSVDISWTVDNPGDILLDGFAVHFLDVFSKRDHENVYASIEPLGTCTSGPNHIFVTTNNQSVCDTGSSAPTCGPPDSCFCPQPECALLFPAPCKSVTSLMPNDNEYFVTVQPDVRHLSYAIEGLGDYEFSITPYYREFANLSPTITSIPAIDICSDENRPRLDEILQDRCVFLNWADVTGAEEYLLVVDFSTDNVTILQSNFTSIESEADICDINPCTFVDVRLFRLIDGNLQFVPLDVTVFVLRISTTPETTAAESTTEPQLVCPRITCGENKTCLEVDGITHECVCEFGYERNDDGDCKAIDPCESAPCDVKAYCTTADEGYNCTCNSGFTGDGQNFSILLLDEILQDRCVFLNWTDVEEAEEYLLVVDFSTDNVTTLQSNFTSIESEAEICDIDYCTFTDVRLFGNIGGNLHRLELDVPEWFDIRPLETTAAESTTQPSTEFIRISTPPETTAAESTTQSSTQSIDPCESASCDINAYCTPNGEGYICTCNSGFTGDGQICNAIDPCKSATCDINAYCTTAGEGYSCTCNSGFTGDGQICNEMNCNSKIISGFRFPRVSPGLTSYSEEKCEGSTAPLASISCIFGSEFEYFDLETLFRTNCGETIKDITMRPANTSKEVTQSLSSLQVLTFNVEELQEEEVEAITQYFGDLTTANLQYTKTNLDNVAEITSHLVDFYLLPDQVETPNVITQKQSLVQSVTTISRKYNSSTSDGYVALSDTINIEVQDVPNNGVSLNFTPQFYSDAETDETVSPIKIEIPAEAIQKADEILGSNGKQSSSVRVVSVGYRSSSLFPSDKETEWVIASSLGDETRSLDGLAISKPVKITNNVIREQPMVERLDEFKTNITYFECVFWDFNMGTWSDEGCRLVDENPPTCECDHLTNFAVLVSKAQVPSNKAIGIVTYVGCGLSVICLVCTVAVIAMERRLRSKNPMQVLMNICVCLGISMLFFIFGVDSDTNTVGCQIITAFLQYFLLATWFWMAAYSHIIYRDVVKMWETRGTPYKILIAAIVSYGVPLVTVILNASIAIAHVDKNNPDYGSVLFESAYTARNFCWLRHNSLYFGFLLPVGILLLVNLVIFCIVIPKITCCRKELQSTASKHTVKQHFVIALVMATTIGLSWIIGYLMLISDNAQYLEATSWIFAIINSSQGIFIFFFTVVRTGELQICFNKQVYSDRYKSSSTASTGVSPPSTMPRSVTK